MLTARCSMDTCWRGFTMRHAAALVLAVFASLLAGCAQSQHVEVDGATVVNQVP
jgi:hypothetical protein